MTRWARGQTIRTHAHSRRERRSAGDLGGEHAVMPTSVGPHPRDLRALRLCRGPPARLRLLNAGFACADLEYADRSGEAGGDIIEISPASWDAPAVKVCERLSRTSVTARRR